MSNVADTSIEASLVKVLNETCEEIISGENNTPTELKKYSVTVYNLVSSMATGRVLARNRDVIAVLKESAGRVLKDMKLTIDADGLELLSQALTHLLSAINMVRNSLGGALSPDFNPGEVTGHNE